MEKTENCADGGIGNRQVVEVTVEGFAESLDARGRPVGEIGKSVGCQEYKVTKLI